MLLTLIVDQSKHSTEHSVDVDHFFDANFFAEFLFETNFGNLCVELICDMNLTKLNGQLLANHHETNHLFEKFTPIHTALCGSLKNGGKLLDEKHLIGLLIELFQSKNLVEIGENAIDQVQNWKFNANDVIRLSLGKTTTKFQRQNDELWWQKLKQTPAANKMANNLEFFDRVMKKKANIKNSKTLSIGAHTIQKVLLFVLKRTIKLFGDEKFVQFIIQKIQFDVADGKLESGKSKRKEAIQNSTTFLSYGLVLF